MFASVAFREGPAGARFGLSRASAGWFRGGKSGQPAEALDRALVDSLQTLLVNAAERALAEVEDDWRSDPATRRALVEVQDAFRTSEQRQEAAAAVVRGWQRQVLDLVSTMGKDKKATARLLAVGVNVLGASLMVVIFASTAGLTGAEIAVAGGTAVAAQRVLEAVFGDGAVRKMVSAARSDLLTRCDEFFALDAEPLVAVTDRLRVEAGDTGAVAEAFDAVEREWNKEQGR